MEVVLKILFCIGILFLIIYLDKKKKLIWAIGIAVGLYFLLVIGVLYYISRPSFNDENFDKEIWFAKPQERFKMAENISESKLLIGKDSLEVDALIGYPTSHYLNNWTYNTGNSPAGFGVDFYYLHLIFKNGKVADCKTSVYVD